MEVGRALDTQPLHERRGKPHDTNSVHTAYATEIGFESTFAPRSHDWTNRHGFMPCWLRRARRDEKIRNLMASVVEYSEVCQ